MHVLNMLVESVDFCVSAEHRRAMIVYPNLYLYSRERPIDKDRTKEFGDSFKDLFRMPGSRISVRSFEHNNN